MYFKGKYLPLSNTCRHCFDAPKLISENERHEDKIKSLENSSKRKYSLDKSKDSAQPVSNSDLNKSETEIPMKIKKCSEDITERILAAEVVFLPETTVPAKLIITLLVTTFYGLRNG